MNQQTHADRTCPHCQQEYPDLVDVVITHRCALCGQERQETKALRRPDGDPTPVEAQYLCETCGPEYKRLAQEQDRDTADAGPDQKTGNIRGGLITGMNIKVLITYGGRQTAQGNMMDRLSTTNATKVLAAMIWALIAATTIRGEGGIELLTGAAALTLLTALAAWEIWKRLSHRKTEPAQSHHSLLLPNITLAGVLAVLALIEAISLAGKTV